MSTTAISYRPIFRFSPCFQSLLPSSHHKLAISEPISCAKHIFRIPGKNTIWRQKTTMAELTKTPSLRSAEDFEGFGVMEQEAILSNGSSEILSQLISGGLEATINKLSKWLVAGVFGIAILWKHDAHAMWAATGCGMNVLLSVALKQVFNQERPVANLRSDPGMPSSHAQSIFFAVAYAILSMVKSVGVTEITVAVGVLAFAFGAYLSWLRVSQKLHTISQVSVGALIGTLFSILWFQAWYTFVLHAFIASLWVRIIVVLGSSVYILCFILHVVQHWLTEEQEP